MLDNQWGEEQIRNITLLENKLMNDLNNFNAKYTCYLRSSANPSPNVLNIQNPCSGGSISEVNNAKALVDDDITQLRNALRAYTGANQTVYNQKYANIINQYNQIVNTRKDLDAKLSELYGTDSGIKNYYDNLYAGTMFSKLMLTIFMTSLAYYTFMKLIKK